MVGYNEFVSSTRQVCKNFSISLLAGLFFLSFVFDIQASSSHPQVVLFLNQVRGRECCDPGSLEHLKQQVEAFEKHHVNATFTLRYDALSDPKYVEYIQSFAPEPMQESTPPFQSGGQTNEATFQLGVFLEITPSLVRDSGVEYRGVTAGSDTLPAAPTASEGQTTTLSPNWYQAQHAYLIGYSLEDRRKIIDTALEKFKQVFGYYPTVTTAWIIDTPSVNYLRETYGVTAHQITREQWGTDSYTLSGGQIHYPYLADADWAFLPALHTQPESAPPADQPTNQSQNEQIEKQSAITNNQAPATPAVGKPSFTNQSIDESTDQPSTLMLRQTISDPLWNYGDSSSAFTSQPNDYARGDREFEYFQKLLHQALHQTHNPYSIAILGLENSMSQEFQDEYVRQIEHVASLIQTANTQLLMTDQARVNNDDRAEQLPTQPTSPQSLTVSQFTDLFLHKGWGSTTVTSVLGKNLTSDQPVETIWITTPYYRARILKNGHTVSLSDLRIYRSPGAINSRNDQPDNQLSLSDHQSPPARQTLTDPYASRSAQLNGYWITPFLIDGSRFYEAAAIVDSRVRFSRLAIKDWLKGKILPEYRWRDTQFPISQSDTMAQEVGIQLPQTNTDLSLTTPSRHQRQLQYTDPDGNPVALLFSEQRIEMTSPDLAKQVQFSIPKTLEPFLKTTNHNTRHTLFWDSFANDGKSPQLCLTMDCHDSDRCTLQTHHSPTFDSRQFYYHFYPFLFPELTTKPLDEKNTLLYAHNRFAVAGRNPVRLVLLPKDELNYTVSAPEQIEVTVEPEVSEILTQQQEGSTGVTFIDLVDSQPGRYHVTITAGEIEKKLTVFFAPNCKTNSKTCILKPWQAIWYLRSTAQHRLRSL